MVGEPRDIENAAPVDSMAVTQSVAGLFDVLVSSRAPWKYLRSAFRMFTITWQTLRQVKWQSQQIGSIGWLVVTAICLGAKDCISVTI